jgi:hypothetical protein
LNGGGKLCTTSWLHWRISAMHYQDDKGDTLESGEVELEYELYL